MSVPSTPSIGSSRAAKTSVTTTTSAANLALIRKAMTKWGVNPNDLAFIVGVSSLAAGHLTLVPELKAELAKEGRDDIAIVRIEQLYPVPYRRMRMTLEKYPNAQDHVWVQEEPANQGPWPFLGLWLPEMLPDILSGLRRISRRAMSAPSSGSSKVHAVEQQEIIDAAFGPRTEAPSVS